MKPEHIYFLVMYDITHPKTLQKINTMLKQWGLERINYSVWLGWANPLKQAELKEKLKTMLKAPETKGSLFYVLPVGKREMLKMRNINGRKPKELGYWLGNQATIFF
jgi:CRISPR-associated endonuclease Cas2